MEQQLQAILTGKHLTACFQPIINLDSRSIYGYEGLIRGPSDSPLHSPLMLFEAASRHNRLVELDILCRKVIIAQFARLDLPGKLFINIDPLTIICNKFNPGETMKFAKKNNLDSNRIIIEITETRPINNIAIIQKTITHYRAMGFRVALDDLGAGYSGLKLWSEIRPDIVKVDRHFIQNVNDDKIKQEFIRTILSTATSLNCTVITEGVETKHEYSTLRKLGVSMAQGYYFARPETSPPLTISAKLFRKKEPRAKDEFSPSIAKIMRPIISVEASETVMTIGKLFTRLPETETLAVIHDDEVIGMVLKKNFMNIYARLYGKELFGKDSVIKHMNSNIIVVEKNMTMEEVSYKLTTCIDTYTEEFIIIDRGRLAGKALLIDLLHHITKLQIRQARHANPLTMLPGNVPIQQQIQKCFDKKTRFTVCYFDLDYFKPFNDIFGFFKGDEVLLLIAELLKKYIQPKDGFIGHIGGDDFIAVFDGNNRWEAIIRKIIKEFDNKINAFYEGKLNDNQTITAIDRQGNKCSYGQMGLSVGAVLIDKPKKAANIDLSKEAALAKHHAKSISGSVLYIHSPHFQ